MPNSAVSVLIVDDRQDVADALRRRFEQAGFKWHGWLPRADELLDYVKKNCPDVVILDVAMPGADPMSVLRQLNEQCPDAKVVVFTAVMERKVIVDALTAGASAIILKDDGPELLISATRSVADGGFVLSQSARELAGLTH